MTWLINVPDALHISEPVYQLTHVKNDFIETVSITSYSSCCKTPKFAYSQNVCCNLPKIQTKRQNLLIFQLKNANGIANSEDPDQTAPLGAV